MVGWPMVDSVAALLRQTCEETRLPEDKQWVLEVVKEAATILPASIIEGQASPYLAEYILGVNAARNAVVVAGYCFRFLGGEGLIDRQLANELQSRLDEIEGKLASLTDALRQHLRDEPGSRFRNN
jgi:hypothetical protein